MLEYCYIVVREDRANMLHFDKWRHNLDLTHTSLGAARKRKLDLMAEAPEYKYYIYCRVISEFEVVE